MRSSRDRALAVSQVEAPGAPSEALSLPAEALVPRHLLDGGECILLAIKPSLWFIPLTSAPWLAAAALLALLATAGVAAPYRWYLSNAAVALAALRLTWATAEWVSRCYVLTNRRIMRIRGFLRVDVFECPLMRIQHTELNLSLGERITRTGSIHIATAGYGSGQTSWRTVPRPLEIHERLRSAIGRAQSRGENGV
ncbi:MAG: PH domain-containing protein [Phycisphaerae bacterium]